MWRTNKIRVLFTSVGRLVARRSSSHFGCGNCERNAQCGLPPHDDCVYRLMQIARDGDRLSQRPNSLYPAVWPPTVMRHENSRH